MRIWTIQPTYIWHILQNEGILYGPDRAMLIAEGISPEFLFAYDWLVGQMEQRIGPRSLAGRYPLWAWYQWEGVKQRRPDLRSPGHLYAGTPGVRIELEVPEEQVLLSDFDGWNFAINQWYLALSEQEADSFYERLEQQGVSTPFKLPLSHDEFNQVILHSWERMFDLDWVDTTGWFGYTTRASKRIQGTLWQIQLSQVCKVTYFTARKSRFDR